MPGLVYSRRIGNLYAGVTHTLVVQMNVLELNMFLCVY